MFVRAAGLGFLPLLDNTNLTTYDTDDALILSANNDQLVAFKHLLSTNSYSYDRNQIMVGLATGTVLEWIITQDLVKDPPIIDYSILLFNRSIPSSLLQCVLERLRRISGATICGFTRINEKIVLDELFVRVTHRKDIQNMDLIVNLAAENREYTILQSESYVYLATDANLAEHVIKHPVYKTAFNHTIEGLRTQRLTEMVFYYFLMTASLHFDGLVFVLIVSHVSSDRIKGVMRIVLGGITNEDWYRLLTINLDFIRFCITNGVTFIENATDLIRLADARKNMKVFRTRRILLGDFWLVLYLI
jgi:hypothetical protein